MKNSFYYTYKENQIVSIMILLSILLHILGMIALPDSLSPEDPSLAIKSNPSRQLIPLRTVGQRDGTKMFSQHVPRGNSILQKSSSKTTPNKVSVLSPKAVKQLAKNKLSKLTPTLNKAIPNLLIPKHTKKVSPPQTNHISVRQAQQLQKIRHQTLKNLSSTIRNSPVIQKSGFYFKFVPPKGIPEDELNSIEKIFYSFQKRTYHSYVTSLISNYYKMLTEKPYIEKTLFTKNERLSGRISIDQDGNITRVRFIQTSESNEIQELFEKTLLGIRNLPNPPKELLKGGDSLNIYFQLVISN